jgi:hypothetical protein
MNVTAVYPIQAVLVEIDTPEGLQYVRYGPDQWYVSLGESYEPIYDCAELETAYQAYLQQPRESQ